MTKPRKKPSQRFHAFLVEPDPEFQPTNWQQTPRHYRIIDYVGPMKFLGSADAWKFLHNHEALSVGTTGRWAIFLDIDAPLDRTAPMLSERFSQSQFIEKPRLEYRNIVRQPVAV